MVEEPIKMLTGLVVFIAIALVFFFAFGAPQCSALANSTAAGLVNGFNTVAKPEFPEWNRGGEPTDPYYYERVPIRLCQEGGTNYLQQFWAGMLPQYQIYYERFPEGFFSGGAGMWEESYPWSGGAGGQLFFWGALRAGKVLGKVGATLAFGKVILAKDVIEGAAKATMEDGIIRRISRWLETRELKRMADHPEELAAKVMTDPAILSKDERVGLILGTQMVQAKSATDLSALATVDFIEQDVRIAEKTGAELKIADPSSVIEPGANVRTFTKMVKDAETGEVSIPIVKTNVPMKMMNPDTGEMSTLYVKRSSGGEIIGTSFEPKPGYTQYPVNPAKVIETWEETAPKEEAAALREVFSTDWKDSEVIYFDNVVARQGSREALAEFGLVNTKWYKHWYEPAVRRYQNLLKSFDNLGYKVNKETIMPLEARGISDALMERPTEDFQKVLDLGDPGRSVKSSIAKAFGKSEQSVTRNDLNRFIGQMQNTITGPSFMNGESRMTAYKAVKNMISDDPSLASKFASKPEDALSVLRSSEKFPADKYPAMAKMSDDELKGITERVARGYDANDRIFSKNTYSDYMSDYAFKSDTAGDLVYPDELASMTGFMTQNTDPLPVKWTTKAAKRELKLETKKIIVLQASTIINPSGWYAKGEVVEEGTEATCSDNQLCLYSQGSLAESPFTLSDDAKGYFLHAWRPTNPAYLSPIQPLLMRIPENPRFYLVSPCYGVAKIWKSGTEMYVSVDKCDANAANYCYADSALTDRYVEIWLASDAATIGEMILSFGGSAAFKTVSMAFDYADPATLGQAMAEAFISWPKGLSDSWDALTFSRMKEAAPKCIAG